MDEYQLFLRHCEEEVLLQHEMASLLKFWQEYVKDKTAERHTLLQLQEVDLYSMGKASILQSDILHAKTILSQSAVLFEKVTSSKVNALGDIIEFLAEFDDDNDEDEDSDDDCNAETDEDMIDIDSDDDGN